jgi:ribosomal protein L32
MNQNPLQKYFRQPKLFVSLPSKGLYYPENTLSGDYNNVPIMAMTGMDEIIMKTPDALFNGEATVKIIESCCPYIKDARSVPSLDIDTLLIAIRMATYGETITVGHTCKNCGTENEYEVQLPTLLEHYQNKKFHNILEIDELQFVFKPLSYADMTATNIENFKLQKMLGQIPGLPVEERQQHLDSIYEKLAEIQVQVFLLSIESIKTPETLVTEKEFIREFLANADKRIYKAIKEKLESNRDEWNVPKLAVKCNNCGTDDSVEVRLDQSNFFV